MPSPSDFFAWLGGAATFAETHPTITICVLVLLLTFGTPEIGSSDKPWIRARSGLGWLALKMVSAYAERTQVFRDFATEVEAFKATLRTSAEKVGTLERVIDWQTRVLLLIASTLKIDVTKTLSSETVAAVSRESAPDLGGKHDEKPVKGSASPS